MKLLAMSLVVVFVIQPFNIAEAAVGIYAQPPDVVSSKLGTSFTSGFRFLSKGQVYAFFWGYDVNKNSYYGFLFESNKLIAVNKTTLRDEATKFTHCISRMAVGNSSSCLANLVVEANNSKVSENELLGVHIEYTGWTGSESLFIKALNAFVGGVDNFFERFNRHIKTPQVGDQLIEPIYSDKSSDFVVVLADKVMDENAAIGIRRGIVEWVYYCGQNSSIDSSLCVMHPK